MEMLQRFPPILVVGSKALWKYVHKFWLGNLTKCSFVV